MGESSDPGRGAAADAPSDYLGARSDPPPRPPPCPNSNQAPGLRGGGDSRFVLQIRPRTSGEISARPGGERTAASRDKRDAWGRYQTGAPPPKQLAHPSPAAPGAAAWRGLAQNPPSLGAHCVAPHTPSAPRSPTCTLPPVEHNSGLACKMASKCISKKSKREPVSRSACRDRASHAGCVRVRVYVFWGTRVLVQMPRVGVLRTWLRVRPGGDGSPRARVPRSDHISVLVCPRTQAQGSRAPRLQGSALARRRPGGAWLHVGPQSAHAQSLCCRRLLLRAAAEWQLAGRLGCPLGSPGAGGGGKSEGRRRDPAAAAGDRDARARDERPCPAPGSALRLRGRAGTPARPPARSLPPSLPPPSSQALPPPGSRGWRTEAFQTWAERARARSGGCGDLGIGHLEATSGRARRLPPALGSC